MDLQKTIFICVFLLLLFNGVNYFIIYKDGYVTYPQAFSVHYEMAKDPQFNLHSQGYPPFWRTVSSPFVFNEQTYYFISVLIVAFIPIFLWPLFKNQWLAFFYLAVSFPFWFELQLAIPQLIVSVWLLYFLFVNNNWFRFFSLLGVMFVHSYGFVLFLLAWFCILLVEFVRTVEWSKFSLGLLPANLGWLNELVFGRAGASLGDLVRFFGRDFNIVFLGIGLKGFLVAKRFDVVLLGVLLFFAGFVVGFRVYFSLALMFLPGIVWGFESLTPKWKKLVFVFSVVMIVLHLFTWFVERVGGLV